MEIYLNTEIFPKGKTHLKSDFSDLINQQTTAMYCVTSQKGSHICITHSMEIVATLG